MSGFDLREPVPGVAQRGADAGGMSEVLKLYKASKPPIQYLFNQATTTTYHGPHLKNFFETIQSGGDSSKLNCPAEIGFESAVQVLKCNELLDAKKSFGTFEEADFKA